MYPSYPCVYKPIPRRSVLARETDVRDASRMRGCEGFLKGPRREQERERERERGREGKEEREHIRGVPEQPYVSLSALAMFLNFCFRRTEIQVSDRLWESKFLLREIARGRLRIFRTRPGVETRIAENLTGNPRFLIFRQNKRARRGRESRRHKLFKLFEKGKTGPRVWKGFHRKPRICEINQGTLSLRRTFELSSPY